MLIRNPVSKDLIMESNVTAYVVIFKSISSIEDLLNKRRESIFGMIIFNKIASDLKFYYRHIFDKITFFQNISQVRSWYNCVYFSIKFS